AELSLDRPDPALLKEFAVDFHIDSKGNAPICPVKVDLWRRIAGRFARQILICGGFAVTLLSV
ncbi:MAG: hypothetical protein K2G94_03620, partial [Muribaculaceae bacterium]|nr:hypothetical protein [Muribaculaceae bacterium]